MSKKKILIIGSIVLIVMLLLISLIFIINKYKNIPVSAYDDIDNRVVDDNIDNDLNVGENVDSETIEIEDNSIIDNTDQNKNNDNNVNNGTDKPSSNNSSVDKNDSTTSATIKPETKPEDNTTDIEEEQTPDQEQTPDKPDPVKYYTSWGMETTAPKYESMDACIQAGEEIRLTSKLADGFYEIGQIGCTEIYDSKKSSRNLLGYNIIELICVDYVYNDDGTRTQVNYDCTDKYLK
ncbi:MAG: hypothetical protein ACLUFU_03300 [Bacilli bacterium]|mgnify:CR=1 FL=1